MNITMRQQDCRTVLKKKWIQAKIFRMKIKVFGESEKEGQKSLLSCFPEYLY